MAVTVPWRLCFLLVQQWSWLVIRLHHGHTHQGFGAIRSLFVCSAKPILSAISTRTANLLAPAVPHGVLGHRHRCLPRLHLRLADILRALSHWAWPGCRRTRRCSPVLTMPCQPAHRPWPSHRASCPGLASACHRLQRAAALALATVLPACVIAVVQP